MLASGVVIASLQPACLGIPASRNARRISGASGFISTCSHCPWFSRIKNSSRSAAIRSLPNSATPPTLSSTHPLRTFAYGRRPASAPGRDSVSGDSGGHRDHAHDQLPASVLWDRPPGQPNSRASHERFVHHLATGQQHATLFTDDYRCPIHVDDLAAALLELATSTRSGIHHIAGPEPISRYELGIRIARRDGLPVEALRPGLRADTAIPGPLDVRLDSTQTQQFLRTHLRGASEFLSQLND